MKYHNHMLLKVIDADVIGGFYYRIYRLDICQFHPEVKIEKLDKRIYHIENGLVYHKLYITDAWTLSNAKEFVDTYKTTNTLSGYDFNVLA